MKKNISCVFALELAAALLAITAIGCSSGGGGDDDGGDDTVKAQFATECGTVEGGSLSNPADAKLQVEVVRVVDSNLVIVRDPADPAAGDILVKLLGLQPASQSSSSVSLLNSLSAGGAFLVPSNGACTATVQGGGTALVGELFSIDGKSFSEELLKSGRSGEVEAAGSCGEDLVAACHSAMREANAIRSAGQITDFLWKPRADSDYNKGSPVIHVNPCNATVIVNGEALLDFGPGNGRCNTSRMFQSCGSFGSNIKVEVIDNESGLPYFNGDDPFVIVPNGCSRYEFKR